jgi:hypothetical protein
MINSALYRVGRTTGRRDYTLRLWRPTMHSDPEWQAGYTAGYEQSRQQVAAQQYRRDTK